MRSPRVLLLLLWCCGLVAGCDRGPRWPAHSAADPAVATPAMPVTITGEDGFLAEDVAQATAARSTLRSGMAYGDFRAQLLDHGWTPVVDRDCRPDSPDAAAVACALQPDLSDCGPCAALPELQACSADGRCRARFRHAVSGHRLEVRVAGDIDAWQDTGVDPGLHLRDWTLVPASG
ncbi:MULTISPECIES: hypothetical protein [Luteimonas]|uniref:hypothetical protein n=1 Tax=Luteimonas TaxID=83614 RepID=UPI00117D46CB|nr:MULTISPECIES: hypothetical protein [Luteimonas]